MKVKAETNALVVPESIVHHTQSTAGILVIVSEAFGVEELYDC
jgi:hypothetical protein